MASGVHVTERRLLGSWDHVIVGAGSAGCVLANRLSANPSNRVLLIEAGGSDNYHWVHIPIGYLYCMGNPRTDWGYKTAPEDGLNGRSLPYPRGKVMGGCSSINGMIYMRGQARDYDTWRQMGNPGWSYREVMPYFLRSENNEAHRGSPFHAQGGPMNVAYVKRPNPMTPAFLAAMNLVPLPPLDGQALLRADGRRLRRHLQRRRARVVPAHAARGTAEHGQEHRRSRQHHGRHPRAASQRQQRQHPGLRAGLQQRRRRAALDRR